MGCRIPGWTMPALVQRKYYYKFYAIAAKIKM